MLAIRDLSTVPEGGWQYAHPSGGVITTFNYGTLYPKIIEAYQANNVPVPTEADVVKWMCENLWISCFETDTREPLINKFTLNMPRPPTSCCSHAPLPV